MGCRREASAKTGALYRPIFADESLTSQVAVCLADSPLRSAMAKRGAGRRRVAVLQSTVYSVAGWYSGPPKPPQTN